MVCGVPAYVDGKMIGIAENIGTHIIKSRQDVALYGRYSKLEPDMA
jgi:predicted oxidoreductase